jgi:hypothetical protein
VDPGTSAGTRDEKDAGEMGNKNQTNAYLFSKRGDQMNTGPLVQWTNNAVKEEKYSFGKGCATR